MSSRTRLTADAPLAFDEARRRVEVEASALAPEPADLESCYGRVLAEEIVAPHALPPFANSAVDGWAVRAADVAGASESAPAELRVIAEVTAGRPVKDAVGPGEAIRIMTGAPVPDGADAVIPLEASEWEGARVFVKRAAAPREHVRPAGEDVAEGASVLQPGRVLGPAEVGLLAALGFPRVRVHRAPRVALLVTGDELLEPHEPLAPGRIRSSNDWTLAGQIREAGATVERLGIARDDLDDLAARLERARQADVLVASGGVSVGDRDLLGRSLERAGFRKIFWRVLASPGKPLLFGRIGATRVFGLPGNPVSSMVAFENFVRPALRRLQGDPQPERARVTARVLAPIEGPRDRRHFARVHLALAREGWTVREIGPRGSGNLRSMVEANALAILFEGTSRVEAGGEVETMVLRAPL